MKYLSFDVGIKNLAFCSLNDNKQILDWGIINLDKNPKCQCGLQKECQKSATFIVTCVPSTASLVPEMMGVVSFVIANVPIDTVGALVSNVALSVAVVVLFAASVMLAVIVTEPSSSGVTTSTDQVPSICTVADNE